MKTDTDKHMYIISGSNGAGKTTFAREFLPDFAHCRRFINPDLIAVGLSPFDPAAAGAQAGKLVLCEIRRAIASGETFAFETTLSGRTYLPIIRHARNPALYATCSTSGYRTPSWVWLESRTA